MTGPRTDDPRSRIPSVERLLASDAFAPLLSEAPRRLVVRVTRAVQEALREGLGSGGGPASAALDEPEWYAERVQARLAALRRPSLRRLINATGVVLHTNLGRSPLADAAREAVARVASSYSSLEYDLEVGGRGSRYTHCSGLLRELTGAEAALVVNNNAAAVVLALNTLAEGGQALISRGELVEIGGSFRIPEIMAKSGARMVEVGATNRTHRRDYEAALGPETAVILTVHRSNFRVTGFTSDVPLRELTALGRAHDVPVLDDLGSGLLVDPSALGLPREPTPADALSAGADVVTMSGDKLLGGPQAGIVLGRADLVARMRRNPLCRAFRVDKMTLAALEATLMLYRDPERARDEIPALRMLAAPVERLTERARAFGERLRDHGLEAELLPGLSAVGGGACPEAELPTMLVAPATKDLSARELAERLRASDPPVVARIAQDRVVLDLRTVRPDEEAALTEVLHRALD